MPETLQPNTVEDFIKSTLRWIDGDSDREHTQRVREWTRNWQFYRGNHYGDFDRNGNWVQLPTTQTEDLRYTDDFMFRVESKATQWSQSSPELSINPTNEQPKTKRAARHIEKELEKYRRVYWTTQFQQSLAKYAMLSTCYWIHTRPKLSDHSLKSLKYSQKDVTGTGTYYCEACGDTGKAAGNDKCPSCGKPVAVAPGQAAKAAVPSGVQEQPDIDIEVELVDPMEIKIDSKCRSCVVSMADWIRRERFIRKYEIDLLYPDWNKNQEMSSGTPERSEVLRYKRALEQGVRGVNQDPEDDEDHSFLRRQYWLDSKIYKAFPALKFDEKFAGVQFKAGEKLFDRYPKGLYVDQINGKHLFLFDENKNNVWTGGVDTIDPTSPYGRGFSGLVNLQEMIDEGVSLGFAYLMRDALGLQIYDPMMIEASDVETTRVGGAIPLKPGAQMEGRPINSALINVESKPLSPFTLAFLQMIDSKMPAAAGGAYDVLGGGTGVGAGAKTLGGQQQQLETASGMIGPALQIRAQAEVEAFTQYLEHKQKFGSPEHFKRLAGDWGEDDAKAFLACNVRQDIEIHPIPNSEVPRTQLQRRADVSIAIQSGLANPEAPIEEGIRRYGLEQLRIPIENDLQEQMRRVAESLLEKMKTAAEYVKKMGAEDGDPDVAQAISQVAALVKQRDGDALMVYKQVFQEYLRSTADEDEVDANLFLAIQMKIDELEQFDVALASDENAKQMMAQAPMAMGQAALEQEMAPEGEDAGEAAQAQAEAQTQQKQAETEMEQQREQFSAQLEQQSKLMDFDEADKQRSHDLTIAQMQAKQQRARN